MRVLVTGATGFLGGHVARMLAVRGDEVIGQGRDPDRARMLERQGLPVRRWDLARDPAPALPGLDAIVHCAALSAPFGPSAAFETANVEATRRLLVLARAKGVGRLVLISSPSVYFAPRDQLDVAEDMPLPRPYTHYARTKRMAEALALAAPYLGPVILRPRGIYGAGDTALLPRLLRAARSGPLPLLRRGRARIDLTHVDDAARAVLAALDAPLRAEGQAFNISGGEVLAVRDIAEAACARAGVPLRWRALPLPPLMLAARLAEARAARAGAAEPRVTRYGLALFAYGQSLNINRAGEILGWQPKISFSTGLQRSFEEAS